MVLYVDFCPRFSVVGVILCCALKANPLKLAWVIIPVCVLLNLSFLFSFAVFAFIFQMPSVLLGGDSLMPLFRVTLSCGLSSLYLDLLTNQ